MVTSTRSSNKNGDGDQAAGSKHQIAKESSLPATKRAKKPNEKKQKTIDETMPSTGDVKRNDEKVAEDDDAGKEEDSDQNVTNEDKGSAEEPKARGGATPSSILEKGIIYFFFRGRVNIEDPSGVDDIARSFIILRPIERDAKLGEGTIGDSGNSRLIAIPKKVLPLSGKDRWLAFVEKSHTSFQTLKEDFLSGDDYVTKTAGTRHTPAATPVGEGIYAITTTGRESHLAYILTLPHELSEVQEEIGLRKQGSFILSTRNPEYEAPAYARLPQDPDFPPEVKEEFRALRWMPTKPKHLDFANTQFLLVGESSGIEKATEPQKDDKKEGKEEPLEEMEKLADEDTHRMEDLKGDDSAAIFADLDANAKEYPKLQTTF
ncbi:hypothetical protein BJ170DRAFT_593893 [Xylariales sp. AK1849]|nr:hypothetical protein BJ170DRAFT_593893 [Xylariales sp. AK1849]